MSDIHTNDSGFDFCRGTGDRPVISNVSRALDSLLPETVSSNPTVRWLRSLDIQRPGYRRSQEDDSFFIAGSSGRVLLAQSILAPALQARLDFLMQSLYPAARVISVSERAIELIAESRQPDHLAATLELIGESQRLESAQDLDRVRLRDAAANSLSDLLASTADLHRQRRIAALQAFEDWLTEANAFRSSFEPAYAALQQEESAYYNDSRLRRKNPDRYVDTHLIRALAPLIAYLSRSPRLWSAGNSENLMTTNRRPLTLSPGEITGILAVLQGFGGTDGSREYEMSTRELGMAFIQLSREPLVQAELASLQRRIADFNPFPEQLTGPPSKSLWVAIQEHILPNRTQSPWLRQFLAQFGREPTWWNDTIRFGSSVDYVYVQALAFSAHSTIIRNLAINAPNVAEPWDEFLERLFSEQWLRPLRKALSRSSETSWTREGFIVIMAAVLERLQQDGYRISIDDQALGRIWDSNL